MPRIRTVKPEFWSHGQVVECSTNARLLFIGLWNFCDDAGRHPVRLKQIKAEVFPADDLSPEAIRGMIDELAENDLITLYVNDNKQFLQVNGWHHQKIDKPQTPRYPGMLDDGSTNDRRMVAPDRIGKERKGKERMDKTTVESAERGPDLGDEIRSVFDYWRERMDHPKAKLDDKRRTKIRLRIQDGYTADDLKAAGDGCTKSPHHMGENDRGSVYDDIELICRDATHVDKFIKLAGQPDLSGLSPAARRTANAAAEWLEEDAA